MTDVVTVKRALVSVSDKARLEELAKVLGEFNVQILSTGGTAAALRKANLEVTDVSAHTGFPEMLDGRVKTLHPKIHGGLLALRDNDTHVNSINEHNIPPIDLVVVNLYPFEATVAKGSDFPECIENIDIGGPSMLRSAAKNHKFVTLVTDPSQYDELFSEMRANNGGTSYGFRKRLAAAGFAKTAAYDAAISGWFREQLEDKQAAQALPLTRSYKPQLGLKYGCNPHQLPAHIYSFGPTLPFRALNGSPGYINLLDALNSWQLVKEARASLDLPAAASFKHVSPAGAAVGVPLSDMLKTVYEVQGKELTPQATAYIRARHADPMSSFGDFAALSDVVDEATALVLKTEVSDGIIAPGYTDAALAILKAKKGGNYVVLEADPTYEPAEIELKEVYGVGFTQKRNNATINASSLDKVVTKANTLPEGAKRDLILASIALKYTQSNSVGYALDGQMVGVGAGQQSRVDCTKLAGRKVEVWWLRQHPKVLALPFKPDVKRQDRVNARVRYIEGDFTPVEYAAWLELFMEAPPALTTEDKEAFLKELKGVALSSDAFFPFRDSIDQASRRGVAYIAQPGGSVADASVIAACDEYNMTMAFTSLRLFHH